MLVKAFWKGKLCHLGHTNKKRSKMPKAFKGLASILLKSVHFIYYTTAIYWENTICLEQIWTLNFFSQRGAIQLLKTGSADTFVQSRRRTWPGTWQYLWVLCDELTRFCSLALNNKKLIVVQEKPWMEKWELFELYYLKCSLEKWMNPQAIF